METKKELLDNGRTRLVFAIPAEEFEAGCEKAYQDTKDKFEITGFRRGRAPRRIVEQHYGEKVFYDDGLRNAFFTAYTRTVNNEDLHPIGYPSITEIGPMEKGQEIMITVEVQLKPEVKLGQYKGLKAEKASTAVTPEDVQTELEAVWKLHADPEDEGQPAKIDDAFIAGVTDYSTVEEYKEFLQKQIAESKEQAATEQLKNDLILETVQNASVNVPEAMIDEDLQMQLNQVKQTLASQGMAWDDYLQFSGKTEEKFAAEFRPQSEQNIRFRLVMEAIAEAEGFTVSEDEMEEELSEMAKAYGTEVEAIRDSFEEIAPTIRSDLLIRKALELILNEAEITEVNG